MCANSAIPIGNYAATVPIFPPVVLYSILYISASLIFVLISKSILKRDISPRNLFFLVAAGLVLRLTLIPVHPIGSDDYYRYLWDGKVMSNGINPYQYAPTDPALNFLHSPALLAKINHADMKTIYPPLAEMLFCAAYKIGGEGFIGLKFLLFLFDLLTVWGIFLVIHRLRLPAKNILFYVLCPLPLIEFFVDGHMDGLGIAFIVFGILFYIEERKILSYILVGLSICIKPVGLILIPLMFFSEKKWSDRFNVVAIPGLVCVLLYAPFIFNGSPFQALITFTENWTFNGVIFDLLNLLFEDNQRTRLVCGALFVLSYLPVIFSRRDLLTKIYISVFLLLIFSPVVHPWYLSWLAFLVPLNPRWSGIAYVSLVSLTSFTLVTYQLSGVWKDYASVLAVEYIPVLAMFVLEMTGRLQLQER